MPRRKRDEGKPKRGLTAYMLFCQEKRPEIKEKNPNSSFGELGKLLGEAWKECNGEDKSRFEEAAAKDKIRYQKELADYKSEHPDSSDDEKKKKGSKKGAKGGKKGTKKNVKLLKKILMLLKNLVLLLFGLEKIKDLKLKNNIKVLHLVK